MSVEFFPGFSLLRAATPQGMIRARRGGSGPPVMLLHGHPRTHTTWYRVAPLLARDFTVICPDLPGFGESYQPGTVEGSSGRAKARALHALMAELGFGRFAIAGHDRGSYRAFRLAMDFPDSVTALAVMDGIPIFEVLERADWRFAADWFHWFFFARSEQAEAAIRADPELWYDLDPGRMGQGNAQDCMAALRKPEVIRGMLADYRAGLEFDYHHDRADREAGRVLKCPLGVLLSARDDMERLYGDPAAPWQAWAPRIAIRQPIDSGHHMAEDSPEDLASHLGAFFG